MDTQDHRPEWLLPGLLPLGTLTVLTGPVGCGKSTLALRWAAQVSRGAPDGTPRHVLVATEDNPATTVVPRLQAAGADLSRVSLIGVDTADQAGDALRLPSDIDALEQHATALCAALIVVDPIQAHVDTSVRRGLAALRDLARRCTLAVLAATYPAKRASPTPRVNGQESVFVVSADRRGPRLDTPNGTGRFRMEATTLRVAGGMLTTTRAVFE